MPLHQKHMSHMQRYILLTPFLISQHSSLYFTKSLFLIGLINTLVLKPKTKVKTVENKLFICVL